MAGSGGPMIEVDGVRKSFGATQALAGVDLTVQPQTVLGLLGPNGAGKTTLVRVLATLLRPDAGSARVAGLDVVRHGEQVRSLIGLAGQFAAVDESLTGRENLEIVGRLYQLGKAEAKRRAQDALERLALAGAADRPVRTYSGGMRRRLDLGASLVGRPGVLLLDEPTTGLDPRTRMELWTFIHELVAEGATVLLTTQYLDEADNLADRIVVVDHGTVIAEGTSDELKARLGGDVLDVALPSGQDLERVAALLAPVASGRPQVDARTNHVTVPVRNRVEGLVSAVRLLDEAGIALDDLALRRPSLDDVFLAVTGRATGTPTGTP